MRARTVTTALAALALTTSLVFAVSAAADTTTQPTQSFTSAGTYYVTVPAYVSHTDLDGLGGAGYPGDDSSSGSSKGGAGGSGTNVHVEVGTGAVASGDVLKVVVGAKGGGGQRGYGSELSGSGGNGGGATIITDITSGNLLLVAGGGGGGGGGSGLYIGYAGGRGGTNGDGSPGIGTFGQDAGRGGSVGQIGNCGLAGAYTQGGTGESAPTASGVGGGGGGGQGACAGGGQSGGSGEHGAGEGGGGGGGAGASYADAFGTDQQYWAGANTGDGTASITFTTNVPRQPVITSPSCIYTGDLSQSKYLPQITASGYPAPALALVGAPSWLTSYGTGYDADGSSSLNPHADGPVPDGQYRLQVKATNAVGSLIDPLTLVVGPTHPVFVSPDSATATAGSSFAFQVQAVGCPPFTQYAITSGQNEVPWLSINAETGELSGLPSASDVGTHTITVQAASGGAGTTLTQVLTVQVNPAAVTPPPVTIPPVTTPPVTTPPVTTPPVTAPPVTAPPAAGPPATSTPPQPPAASTGSTAPTAPKSTKPRKPSADLSVHLVGPATVRTGRTFTETLTVSNHGPHRAGRVHVALRVPHGFAVTDAAGATRHGRALRWGIPVLAAHTTRTYTLTLEVVTHRPGHRTIRAAVRSLAARDRHEHNNHRTDRLRIVRPQ